MSFKFPYTKIIPLLLIFLISLPKRLIFPFNNLFAFNYDQGRDFLAVSKIIYEKDLTLIGQTTGLQGVFYGPWWYYFLAPLIYVFGGDPQKVAIALALFGAITVVATYLLLKTLTNNSLISFALSIVVAISNLWMFGPVHIWHPSITPLLLIVFVYILHKIVSHPKPLYYFALGIVAFLAIDTSASFGFIFAIYLLISPFIFKKQLLRKEYLLVLLGAFLILSPRLIFEFKNNFLISKSVISILTNPPLHFHQISIYERLTERPLQYLRIIAEGFTRNVEIIGLVFIVAVMLMLIKTLLGKTYLKIRQDFIFLYLVYLIVITLIFFTIYPASVWDYYLVGMPTIFLVLIAKILGYASKNRNLKRYVFVILGSLIILNIRSNLLPPYTANWQGDGGTYNNEKKVVDYISEQNPHNYSVYAYSPAIYDYPFDYLIYWYGRREILEKPKDHQSLMYLIIREASTKKYLTTGWYGDKTRDKTEVIDRAEFPGDLLVEKHRRID